MAGSLAWTGSASLDGSLRPARATRTGKTSISAYILAFLLAECLHIFTLYLIVTYTLRNRETWAYHALLLMGICWPAGGAVIALLSGATSYFISVGMMALLFLPVIVILWSFFKSDKTGKTGPPGQHH
jgi:hypothetical protein